MNRPSPEIQHRIFSYNPGNIRKYLLCFFFIPREFGNRASLHPESFPVIGHPVIISNKFHSRKPR